MSYHRPRALSGVQSRPYGSRVGHRSSVMESLGGVQSRPYGSRVGRRSFVMEALGESDPDVPDVTKFSFVSPDDGMDEAVWRSQMLAATYNQAAWLQRWVERDELQRWLQLAATLSIPLAAAVWKAIFRGGRGNTTSSFE